MAVATTPGDTFLHRSHKINWCDQTLYLHAEKVIYWAEANTLLAADIHMGKEHVFGRAGIAIPGGLSEDTLNSLMSLVDICGAERLLILGDFVHDVPANSESWQLSLVKHLDTRSELAMNIVAGNHDKLAARERLDQRVLWHSRPLHEPPFVLMHEPVEDARGYGLAGHIHPVCTIGSRRQKLRAPVFWFQQAIAVLPAFGHFTGGYAIDRAKTDRLFMTGPDSVIEV